MNKKDFNNLDKGLKEFLDYLHGKKDKGLTIDKFKVNKTSKKTIPLNEAKSKY